MRSLYITAAMLLGACNVSDTPTPKNFVQECNIIEAIADYGIGYSGSGKQVWNAKLQAEKIMLERFQVEPEMRAVEDPASKLVDLTICQNLNSRKGIKVTNSPARLARANLDRYNKVNDTRFTVVTRFSTVEYLSTPNEVKVLVETDCGMMCAQGTRYFLKEVNGKWIVDRTEFVWAA